MPVRCLAKQDGLVGSHYVRAGEVFEFEGAVPSWAEPVEEPAAPEPKSAAGKKRKPAKKSGGGKTEDLFGE